MNSTRLPNKIMKLIKGKPALYYLIDRLKKSKLLTKIIIATTVNEWDNPIVDFCKENNLEYFRGNENDVLDRYYKTALKFNCKDIMRITSDCILMDTIIVDDMIEYYQKNKLNYLIMKYSNNIVGAKGGFPDGFNPEIFSFKLLEYAKNNAKLKEEKEHFSIYLRKNLKNIKEYEIKLEKKYENIDFKNFHLSLDTQKDFDLINEILNYFNSNNFKLDDILEYLHRK
jgi:spore coat polysaccharide biosynthesis protein SpsF